MKKADVVNAKHLVNQLARLVAQLEIKNAKILKTKARETLLLFCDFSQLSTQRVRNKKLPAMRVGNNRLYQKITLVL